MDELNITAALDAEEATLDTVNETTESTGLIGKIVIFGLGLIAGIGGTIAASKVVEHKKTVTWFDREIRDIGKRKKQQQDATEEAAENETTDND